MVFLPPLPLNDIASAPDVILQILGPRSSSVPTPPPKIETEQVFFLLSLYFWRSSLCPGPFFGPGTQPSLTPSIDLQVIYNRYPQASDKKRNGQQEELTIPFLDSFLWVRRSILNAPGSPRSIAAYSIAVQRAGSFCGCGTHSGLPPGAFP